jgi:hypothetical protein
MLLRFAVAVTIIELVLTAFASVLVSYTDPPASFATEADLRALGMSTTAHENRRWLQMDVPCYETKATLTEPVAQLWVSHRTLAGAVDVDFRRSREEVNRAHPERGETTIIDEPLPGEKGYAVRQAGPKSSRFELVRLRGNDLLIVRVLREKPYDAQPGAEMARCERRARVIQEMIMTRMRWRD